MRFLPQETFPDLLLTHPSFIRYLVDGYKVEVVEAAEPEEGWSRSKFWRVILLRKDNPCVGVKLRKAFYLVEKDGQFDPVG